MQKIFLAKIMPASRARMPLFFIVDVYKRQGVQCHQRRHLHAGDWERGTEGVGKAYGGCRYLFLRKGGGSGMKIYDERTCAELTAPDLSAGYVYDGVRVVGTEPAHYEMMQGTDGLRRLVPARDITEPVSYTHLLLL